MTTEGSPNRCLVFARVGGRLCEAADAFGGRVAESTLIRTLQYGHEWPMLRADRRLVDS